ncbi:hypothetical protein ITP53_11875 [Nonomuraea sp. K274]|uniref:Peptidase MA superfamily protein n=1 Tax=Nonomuraea cypriaca TaxID=1187855 RepID=A0A931A511_9ACTN|nr:hypothetical protein [Nonomuraea cypriaca]MBF8186431.1 hypothetical protein [Nonomuraea cypriaca]
MAGRGRRTAAGARRRKWVLLLAGFAVLVVAAVAGVVTAFPSVAATTCPGCYGLERLRPGVYAEPGLSEDQRRHVVEVVEQAHQRVRDFYGGQKSSPSVLVCLTDTCYRRIGGGRERGIAVLNRAVMLSPHGADPVIASHELSHVELHARLAGGAEQVPQWFDEGLAVLVSDDRRYLARETAGDRCLVDSREALPVTLEDWLRMAGTDHQTYAKAACQVNRWVQANGGRDAVLELIEQLSAGGDFGQIMASARSGGDAAGAS